MKSFPCCRFSSFRSALSVWFSFIAATTIFCFHSEIEAQSRSLDRVLAVVSGSVILESDVRSFVALGLVDDSVTGQSNEEVTSYLIRRRLMIDEIERYGLQEPIESMVDLRMFEVLERFSSETKLSTVLENVGLSLEDLRQLIKDDVKLENYIEKRFSGMSVPTESQLQEYYDLNQDDFRVNGFVLSFGDARSQVLEEMEDRMRTELVIEWVEDLQRRGDVMRVPFSP
ncbi:MAG: hypothetical protein CMM58_13650 [Rhodospirillaceae bacterium]|nr:hypothetical protein [Rhodospirillaceae bacterium]|tara:strand:- start:1264 stop:1947 length:684 start_codon:yes stop_codon:yes gene_type:complete